MNHFAKIRFTEQTAPRDGDIQVEASAWVQDPGNHAQLPPDFRCTGTGKTLADAKSDAVAGLAADYQRHMNAGF